MAGRVAEVRLDLSGQGQSDVAGLMELHVVRKIRRQKNK
jgi:hypothetical protein